MDLEKNLSQLFRQLGNQQTATPDLRPDTQLKNAVFSTIDATSVIADIVDLFTVKFIQSQAEVVDALPGNDYGMNEKEKLFKFLEKKFKEEQNNQYP
jgi:predicted aldo/keto reductase-like oxidoreductase